MEDDREMRVDDPVVSSDNNGDRERDRERCELWDRHMAGGAYEGDGDGVTDFMGRMHGFSLEQETGQGP